MIRPYSPEDQTKLINILRLNIPQYFDPSEEDDFIKYLDTDAENYFVVEDDGIIIGSGGINFFPEEKIARISWDIIHPDFQGKGIGKKLTLFRIDQIKKQSMANVIHVRTSQLAYQFYQKIGFDLKEIEKDYWSEGYDLYLMSMELKICDECASRYSSKTSKMANLCPNCAHALYGYEKGGY